MTAVGFTESVVELAALEWFEKLGYDIVHGPDISPDGPFPLRTDYRDVIHRDTLHQALTRINPNAPPHVIDSAIHEVVNIGQSHLISANQQMHTILVNGVTIDTHRDGELRGEHVFLIDWEHPENNVFQAINQFTIKGNSDRRPDIIVFVNGIPLAGIELKNMGDERTGTHQAYDQFQTYKQEIPKLYWYNALLLISDGTTTELGTITTPRERWSAWKTVDGETLLPQANLETAIRGIFPKETFLDLIRNFIVFEDDGKDIQKKIAQYHQYHAVRKAMSTAMYASGEYGDGKGGVVWHTQGSGKSLTMLFFAGKLARSTEMANPTIIMLTDRNDLDDQLFGTFSRGQHLLRQQPVQASSRKNLRELLNRQAGGVIFTTIQMFYPEGSEERFPKLSDRRNIMVMADEAHRTQYGFDYKLTKSGTFQEGFAQHMRNAVPNATFVAFTGTPIDLGSKSTRLVFGDYIDIYDVGRAIKDGATVPIHYESRLVQLDLPEDKKDWLDDEFEELTEELEESQVSRASSKWSQLEKVIGTAARLETIAKDLVAHADFRFSAMHGKIMIVAMSRRICIDLYEQIARLRPDWHSDEDAHGAMKVVMTGSATDPVEWQKHIRDGKRREELANRFKDPDDPFKIVIVRDMWLTGFDVPSLHTMYIDKPMKGHGLMQAIARVNRVFRGKPGGLVVDYIGIGQSLKDALRIYMRESPSGDVPVAGIDPDDDLNVEYHLQQLTDAMIEKLVLCRRYFHGFNYDLYLNGAPSERMKCLADATNFLLQSGGFDTKSHITRFLDDSLALSKAFKLAASTKVAQQAKREISFFLTLRGSISKLTGQASAQSEVDLDYAISQLVDQAVAPDGVVDIFAVAGLPKPDISVLSDSFLDEIRDLPQKNLALEMLNKLLNDEIRSRARKTNAVLAKKFSDRLDETLNRYRNRGLETAEIIEALIKLAQELQAAQHRGEELGMTEDEVAFYDALSTNLSAIDVYGDDQLRVIAREVADTVRKNTTIDWTVREQAQADLRRMVKRVLRKYGYPPDQQDSATATVLEQAKLWAEENAA